MNALEQRMLALEQHLKLLQQSEVMTDAMMRTLYTFVEELVEDAGMEEGCFLKHFEDRFRFWLEHYTRAEKHRSQEAAQPGVPLEPLPESHNVIPYKRLFDPKD